MKLRFGQKPKLTPAQQFFFLRANAISEGRGGVSNGSLVWRFAASPGPLSREYSLRVEYGRERVPRVVVEAPDLRVLAEGRKIPHVYREDPMVLCLYRPKRGEWTPWMRLDQTVVPWAMTWLFYFEDWLRAGEWRGGGEHPDGSIDPFDEIWN